MFINGHSALRAFPIAVQPQAPIPSSASGVTVERKTGLVAPQILAYGLPADDLHDSRAVSLDSLKGEILAGTPIAWEHTQHPDAGML